MYQNTPKSKERLVDSENTYVHSIKILHHYNSAVKFMCVLSTDFKFLHLAHVSTSILHIITIILWYYLNFKVLIYRFQKFFKPYLMYNSSYIIPLWRKARFHWNHLQHCNIQFIPQLCIQSEDGLQSRNMLLMMNY